MNKKFREIVGITPFIGEVIGIVWLFSFPGVIFGALIANWVAEIFGEFFIASFYLLIPWIFLILVLILIDTHGLRRNVSLDFQNAGNSRIFSRRFLKMLEY